MKVIVIIRGQGSTRFVMTFIRALCGRGHSVKIVYDDVVKSSGSDRAKALELLLAEFPHTLRAIRLRVHLGGISLLLNQLLDFRVYLDHKHPSAHLSRRIIPGAGLWAVFRSMAAVLLRFNWVSECIRNVQAILPRNASLTEFYKSERPDFVACTSNLLTGTTAFEHIRAATELGIPTALSVLSWDNATTKGTFHFLPDFVFVWNQIMADELEDLHNVPRRKILVLGAANFDAFFHLRLREERRLFLERLSLDPNERCVIYLCSSSFIANREVDLVRRLIEVMRVHAGLERVNILIRPHPANAIQWSAMPGADFGPRVTVYPAKGEFSDLEQTASNFYHSLYHSDAAIGINTSGFIEAAIVDKPIVTIINRDYADKQTGLGHFHQLLRYDFIETATSLEDAVKRLDLIVNRGEDVKREKRQVFVRDFIRPNGLGSDVGKIMARAVEMLASGLTIKQVEEKLPETQISGLEVAGTEFQK